MDLKASEKGRDGSSNKRNRLNASGQPSLKTNHPMYGRVGFRNAVNTCYLNTAFQLLSHMPDITMYFISRYPEIRKMREEKGKVDESVLTNYISLMEFLWNRSYCTINPNPLKVVFDKRCSTFKSPEQHDTIEFFMCFVEMLNDDLKNENKNKEEGELPTTPNELWLKKQSIYSNPVFDNLYGLLCSVDHCVGCGDRVQYDCFNCLTVPLPRTEDYVIVNFLKTVTMADTYNSEQIKYRGVAQQQFLCRMHCEKQCRDLYDQMSVHLGQNITKFDLILYARGRRILCEVLRPTMSQSLLYQHRERGSFLICCLKPNPSSIPLLLQCASWRYTLNENVRKSSFLRVGFPRILYVNPSDTFQQVFSQVDQYVFPEYRHHLALFQKRMEVIVQLVFASVSLQPIRKEPQSQEKKVKKDSEVSSSTSTVSPSGSVIGSSESEVNSSGSESKESGSAMNEETESELKPADSESKPVDTNSNSSQPNTESKNPLQTNNNTPSKTHPSLSHESHKRQFFETLHDPVKCYPVDHILSWLNFSPGIPVINHYLYSQAQSSSNPPVWLSFIFRQEHLQRPVSSLIGVQGSVKSLFMLLDVDEGVKPIIPVVPANDERRKRILANYSREVTEPEYSMDVDTVREYTQGQNKREEVPLEVCLNSVVLNGALGKTRNEICCHCNSPTIPSSTTKIYRLPPYLVIHLSRCEYDSNRTATDSYLQHKITTNVIYPLEDLDMSPYLADEVIEDGVSYLYDLIGVACHRGSGMEGHYSAICRDNVDGVNKWFRYSDDTVEEVTVRVVRNADACALVYSRKGVNTHSALDIVHYLQKKLYVCYKQNRKNDV